ncbi:MULTISPECIES: tRNA (adenosine(37)-N6)-threonylcarbamoyltransferase complex dimerization subunit type 1 TsaB [Lysobacter]|uniref:tRNA (adenosine(37)-N6)-threonylcarbamoyltransferase complex dimerization subunit type 1 TsaB n=1 Tax=Lysobacter TaxID=68 RepID=UPI001F29C0B3|nr:MULTISPECIES: tRNA (adenosine(37)-N6)-threonylcarbamoyltransferase complex dimerization subunit type 1 TsaB [Lysobacter]UJB20317.1 tRNA (adenosine(37)-N6)-threonylcarbamoyltransferase complex dimerization subunit type 1 TsaB [Lysobacter capsici]UJQ30569.1 tRNA (adenosine(37)-N6)-threonylcarbamoyltransferase complex dimerization subunit type 1 TsaB [Lysobacter gummosus]
MNLLAFETSTEACSVALWLDGEVRERYELAPRRHAELSLPWAEQLLDEAGLKRSQLDAIAIGRGPGAFTGVRLAIALAQGIALALDKPIVPVSTLAVLALRARAMDVAQTPTQRVFAAIDARMGEVYTAAFELRGMDAVMLDQEVVVAPAEAVVPDGDEWLGVGSGFAASEGLLAQRLHARFAAIDPAALPHAADLARLAALAYARGEAVAPEFAEPAYLRNNVALTIAEQKALKK